MAISLGIVKVNIATASFNSLAKKVEEYIERTGAHNYFDLNEAHGAGGIRKCKAPYRSLSLRKTTGTYIINTER